MHHQHPTSRDYNNTMASHHWRGAPSSSVTAQPGAPRWNSFPLPIDRLSPLLDRDQPLPDVPFAMKLAVPLIWGVWRYLPSPRASRRRNERTDDALREPATSPPVGELSMTISIDGQSVREVRIRPRTSGATAVSILDVIDAAKEVQLGARQIQNGTLPNNGQSFGRSHDGTMVWRGLIATEDDHGALVLFLRV